MMPTIRHCQFDEVTVQFCSPANKLSIDNNTDMIQATMKLMLCAILVLQTMAFAPAVVPRLMSRISTLDSNLVVGGRDAFRNEVTTSRPSSNSARLTLRMSDEDFAVDATQGRIAALVAEHPVILFMKGSKLFPQCGFSNTASQILQSYNIDFHTVDVLAGEFR